MNNFSGINAKIKAMQGRLLKREDYAHIAACNDIAEAARTLKGFETYGALFEGMSEGNVRRWELERQIFSMRLRDMSRIHGFISDFGLRSYLEAVMLRDEIRFIKQLLSAACDERDIAPSAEELRAYRHGQHTIDIPALLHSGSVTEFIGNLSGTPYYGSLSKLLGEGEPTIFDVGMKLDFYYYMNRFSAVKHLDSRNKKVAEVINVTEADVVNIQWIYRLKHYYGFEPQRIYGYLLPLRRSLSKDEVMHLVEAKDGDEFWTVLGNTAYGGDFQKDKPIENGANAVLSRAYRRVELRGSDTLAATLGYLFRRNQEMKSLIASFEGVRYGMQAEEIMQYISV